MSTTYEEIYDLASRKLTDVELPLLPEEELEDTFHGYLLSSIAQFRKCKNDLSDRDENEKQFNVDLLDKEKEILAVLIARQWLQPQINSALLTKQVFSDKESKFYSQKEMLAGLMSLDEKLKIEAQKLSRDYTYSSGSYWY